MKINRGSDLWHEIPCGQHFIPRVRRQNTDQRRELAENENSLLNHPAFAHNESPKTAKRIMKTPPPKSIPAYWPSLLCALLLIGNAVLARSADLLEPGKPIVVAGTHGRFDFLAIDVVGRKLLAAHTGNKSLDVIDIDRKEVIKVLPTGAAQAPAIDSKGKRYFVTVSKPPQLVTVDSGTLEITGKVPLVGPPDLLAFNEKSGRVYAGHDDGKDLWVIDPDKSEVVATIDLPNDSPEDLGFDSSFQRLFRSMKTGGVVAVIDIATNKVIENWPTAPVQTPHGMAMLPEAAALLVAGGNGKLVMMSQKDGHVITSVNIPARVDQLAYDPDLHRVYCASGTGRIAIVGTDARKLSNLGEVASSEGCHSIAVDPKTHTVWIAYAKGETSIVQPLTTMK